MNGLMMDYPLTLQHFLERAARLFPNKEIVTRAMNEGLLLNCTHDTVLRFLPPYIVTETEIDQAVSILEKVFRGL